MDYLEGFLIGPVWSDTDYRTRRHYYAHIFLATLMGAAFTFFLFFPDTVSTWIIVPYPLSLVLLIALMLTTPILSSIYYRVPFFIRPFLLILYAVKYVLLFYTLVHFFFPLVTVDKMKLPAFVLARVDDRMTRALDRFGDSGRVLTTVAGVLVGAFWIIAEGLLVVLVLIAVPLAAICLLKGVRHVLDIGLYELIDRFVIRGSPVTAEDIPWLGNVADDMGMDETASASMPFFERRERRFNAISDDMPRDGEEEWGPLEAEQETLETVRFVPVLGVDDADAPESSEDFGDAEEEGRETETVKAARFAAVLGIDEAVVPESSEGFGDAEEEGRETETVKAAQFAAVLGIDEAVVPESSEGFGDLDDSLQDERRTETVVTDNEPDGDYRKNSGNKYRIVDKLRFIRDGYRDVFFRKDEPEDQAQSQIEKKETEIEREEREVTEE